MLVEIVRRDELLARVLDDHGDDASRLSAMRELALITDETTAGAFARALTDSSPKVQRAAARRLRDDLACARLAADAPKLTDSLGQALVGPNEAVGRAAGVVLRLSTLSNARELLTQQLNEGPPAVKIRIASAQSRVAADDEITLRLASTMTDPDPSVRQAAHDALRGQMRPTLAEAALSAATRVSPERASLALRSLAEADVETATTIANHLSSPDPQMRVVAARALRPLEYEVVTRALREALSDINVDVRIAALESLSHRSGPEVLEALDWALGDSSSAVRELALRALTTTAADEATAILCRRIGHPDREIRSTVVESLGRRLKASAALEKQGAVTRALAAATADVDPGIRETAVRALAAVPNPIAVQALRSTLRDDIASIREQAALGLEPSNGGEAVIRDLILAVDDPTPGVRTAALWSLSTSRELPVVQARARHSTLDSDLRVRLNAVALLSPSDAESLRELVRVVTGDDHRDVRLVGVERLVTTQDTRAVPVLRALLQSPDPAIVRCAVEGLARRSPLSEATRLLLRAAERDSTNRQVIASALRQSPRPDVNGCLVESLSTSDRDLRLMALTVLAERRARDIEPLLGTLSSDPDARIRSLTRLMPQILRGGYRLRQTPEGLELVPETPTAGLDESRDRILGHQDEPTPDLEAVEEVDAEAMEEFPKQAAEDEDTGAFEERPNVQPYSAYPLLKAPDVVPARVAFDVTIGLTQYYDSSTAVTGLVTLQTEKPEFEFEVELVVDSASLKVEGELIKTLNVTGEDKYPSHTVKVTAVTDPKLSRERTLRLLIRREGMIIGMAKRTLIVVDSPDQVDGTPKPAPPGKQMLDLDPLLKEAPPELVVGIYKSDESADVYVWDVYPLGAKVRLEESERRSAIDATAKDFAGYMKNQMTSGAFRGKQAFLELAGYGDLIQRLMPTGVRTALRDLVAGRSEAPSVLFLTEEPFVPWELAVLRDPPLTSTYAGKARFLGAHLAMSRWPSDDADPPPAPAPRLGIKQAGVLTAKYDGVANWPKLEAAEAEAAEFLKDNPTTLTIEPRLSDVEACLEGTPPLDLLHVALHGQFDPTHGEDGLVLLEPDGDSVKVAYLTALAVRGLRENSATTPFVFLNACQVGAADKVLGSFAGFAAAVLRTKACGVVAPLWNIDDKVAAKLSARFYKATLGKDALPVAEVLRAFRAEFTLEGVQKDPEGVTPTFVAYQFFGHPRFTLQGPS